MKKLPTKPVRIPRTAVRMVRTVRKFSQSNTMSNILADIQNAVVKCFTKDVAFVLVIAAVIFLASVNLFDIRQGPMSTIFAKYIDTTIGKWCATNVLKMNGLVTLAPVVFKFKPAARLAAGVLIMVAVIMLHPASEIMYGAAAACILAALELKHPVNVGLMLTALSVIVGITALQKSGITSNYSLTDAEWKAILNARESVASRPKRWTADDFVPEGEEIEA